MGCEALRALAENHDIRSSRIVRELAVNDRKFHASPVIKILDLMKERLFVAKASKHEDTFAVDIISSAARHGMLRVREYVFSMAKDLIDRNIENKVMKQLLVDGFSEALPSGTELPMRSAITAVKKYAELNLPIDLVQKAISQQGSHLTEEAKNKILEVVVETYK